MTAGFRAKHVDDQVTESVDHDVLVGIPVSWSAY